MEKGKLDIKRTPFQTVRLPKGTKLSEIGKKNKVLTLTRDTEFIGTTINDNITTPCLKFYNSYQSGTPFQIIPHYEHPR
jgi:hypothetical protein